MAKANSLLPDSYYDLLMTINYGMLVKDILKCRVFQRSKGERWKEENIRAGQLGE